MTAELAATARSLLEGLAAIAVQGTLLALVVALFARVARPRPSILAALWLVVVAKFALPWSPALPWSLADLLASFHSAPAAGPPPAIAIPTDIATATAPVASLGWLLLAAAWLAGALVVIVRVLVADRAAIRAARRATPAPPEAAAVLAALHPRARLAVGDSAHGPFVLGVLRPVVVVPPDLLAAEPALLRAALLHEIAHVRRLDAAWRVVQLLAAAAFWWWPVVRLANRRLDAARETACDATALAASDVARPAYARLLLRMAQRHAAAAPALATRHALGGRIAALLDAPPAPRRRLLHVALLALWIPIALGGARSAEARGDEVACVYSPELASALRAQYPQADADGDGILSHHEACELQAELSRRASENPLVSTMDEVTKELLAEPLCCNCSAGEGTSRAAAEATCTQEGAFR